VTDTTHHIREDSFPSYDDIYKIFNVEYFPLHDEDLEVYQNVKKSGIHIVVSPPTLFPYDDVSQWCFKKFNYRTCTIVNKHGRKIESLRPEDVGIKYHLPKPICSLNETFLKGFTRNNKYPAN
jgi:hypothetical protein